MTTLEVIQHNLIDRILATNNEALLKTVADIFDSSQDEEPVKFTPAQIKMLEMSEDDIRNGRLISEEELERMDREWL